MHHTNYPAHSANGSEQHKGQPFICRLSVENQKEFIDSATIY